MSELRDAVALVTGASAGIGREIARDLARRGVGALVLVARRKERLDELAAELGSRARARTCDLADARAVAFLAEAEPRVDVLVNNAGFGHGVPFDRADPARVAEMVDVNCRALVQLTRAFLPGMIERGRGWVLNVGSIAGMAPMPTHAVYGASKAFVASFSEALRAETRGTGVCVHLLAPGPVDTEFFEVARPNVERLQKRNVLAADAVARESLDALFDDRPRLVPDWRVALGAGAAALMPMPLLRPVLNYAAPRLRKRFAPE